MRRSCALHVPWLLAIPTVVGCTGSVSGSGAGVDAEAASTTTAVVIVERTTRGEEGTRAEASARFVRVAAPSSPREGLRVIGAAGDLPRRGTCASVSSFVSGPEGPGSSEPAPVVELLDVGAVSLEASGMETRLIPRQLPDVTDVVSGIVYARAADSSLLPAAVRYTVRVGGRADLGAFQGSALAPADPSLVRISGENERGTQVLVGEQAAIEFSWDADGTADLVYVDVQPAGVRCVLGDGVNDGTDALHAILPASLLDDKGTLVVHRLHLEPLRAPGLDQGEIRFDFASSLAYARH